MIDEDVAYASPSTVYRVLKEAGTLQKKTEDKSRGKGGKWIRLSSISDFFIFVFI